MFSLDKYKMGALVVALALCGSVTFACDSSSDTTSGSSCSGSVISSSQVQPMQNQNKHG